MTSFITEFVAEPVTRSFDGGRTYRPRRSSTEEDPEVIAEER